MIDGLCNSDIAAPLIFEGSYNDFFGTCVKNILIEKLRAGQVVVMDIIIFIKILR